MAREGLWVGLGTVIGSVAGLLINLIVPNTLDVADSAAFFISMSAVNIIGMVVRFGFDRSLVRLIAESRATSNTDGFHSHVRTAVVAAVAILFGSGLFFGLIGWPFLATHLFHSAKLASLSIPICLWIAFEAARMLPSEALRGMRSVLAATVLGNAGRGCLAVALLLAARESGSRTLAAVLSVSAIASGATFVLALGLVIYRLVRTNRGRLAGPTAVRVLFAASWPFYITGLWAFANNQGDVLVGGIVLEKGPLALYAVASKLSLLLTLPALALNLVLAPTIPRFRSRSQRPALERQIRTATTLYAVPILVSGLLLVFANKYIIGILYPSAYRAAGGILAVLAIGPICTALTGPNGFTMMMAGHGGVVTRTTSIVSGLQVAAMFIMGKYLGYYGLAAASSLGTVVLNLSFSVLIRAKIGIATEPYWRPSEIYSVLTRFVQRQFGRAAARSSNGGPLGAG